MKMVYLVGEALVGKGVELAHIDLIIGEKSGPVGTAFAQGMTNVSHGHSPLLAVIRPNLPPKPHTLIIPKVTVKDMGDAEKIFGPAQAAVAKAVADSLEEGVIPKDKVDDWVIICSVFIHPEAKDYRRIYHYNYAATKLSIQRALSSYPPVDKIMYDKDRATHPVMGFRVPRLWRPPYLQIALDIPSLEKTKKIIAALPQSDNIVLEAGTPLIKRYGTTVIGDLREVAQDKFIVADLKTLDVGKVEVDLAFDESADAVVVSGLASIETIDQFIYETNRLGIYSFVDMMNVPDPIAKLQTLKMPPNVIIMHRGIDTEGRADHKWEIVKEVKAAFKGKRLLVSVAGGIRPDNIQAALKAKADIITVGRYITQSHDVERSTREFLTQMQGDIDLFRVHTE
ncbi:MAG: bifunctional 5,6,7,8-tetrahydromethanopterin hydro-lyase/3-hexulose-6-phosphate synthase [Candidatus Hodarchaeota archaeon]